MCSVFSVCKQPPKFQFIPLDEVVEEILDSLLQVGFLQGDWVAFVGDLDDQFSQFVQLAFDLEEALGCQSKPEEEKKADFGCRCCHQQKIFLKLV